MFLKKAQDENNLENSILLNNLLQRLKEEREASFRHELAEDLGFSTDVIATIMKLEFSKSLRKRLKLLTELKEAKDRVFQALLLESDENETSNDDHLLFNPSVTLEELQARLYNLVFKSRTSLEELQSKRKEEQATVKKFMRFQLEQCRKNASDMQELIDWMGKFTFELTWEDIEVKPLETREEEEEATYRTMVRSLRRAWDCTKSLTNLVEKLASDDEFDYLSGKVPSHLLEATNREVSPLWCSSKLRTKLKNFEKLRSSIKVDKRFPEKATEERQITILTPEEKPKATPLKELEGSILNEISDSWKEASGDVAFYIKESLYHRFTKPSCRMRLKRALLLLEFLNAALEGKLIKAEKTLEALNEAQSSAAKMQEESSRLESELSDKSKQLIIAKQKIKNLKKQITKIIKENEKLQTKKNENQNQIDDLEQQIYEYKSRPKKEELEDCLLQITALENELNKFKIREIEMKETFDEKNKYYEELVLQLSNKRSSQLMLEDELTAISEKTKKATQYIAMLKDQLKRQSLRAHQLKNLKDQVAKTLSEDSDESTKLRKFKRNRRESITKTKIVSQAFHKDETNEGMVYSDEESAIESLLHEIEVESNSHPTISIEERFNKEIENIQNASSETEKKKQKKKFFSPRTKKQKMLPLDESVQTEQIEKETPQEVSASEASNITTTTTTFLNQAINSSDKNTEETSKKKKSMLERHLNAFAEIFADHIIEVSEDEYFATENEENIEANNELRQMLQSARLKSNEEEQSKDITQKISSMKTHYVTEFPNFSSVDIGTKNQIDSVAHNELQIGTETNLNSSFSVDDNSKNEKISAVSLQSCTEPNETHTGKIEVSQSLITSDDFQTLRNAEDDIPILKPSTGSKRRRAGKNITESKNKIKRKRRAARFGNQMVSSSNNNWYRNGRESFASAMFLKTSQVQILPRESSKPSHFFPSTLYGSIIKWNTPVSSLVKDESPELPPEAKVFAKQISIMIHQYFSKINKKLIESLKCDKKKLELEIEKLKDTMIGQRASSQMAIEKLKKDKDSMEVKLEKANSTPGFQRKASKYLSMKRELLKAIKEYEEEKLRLIKISQDFSSFLQKNKSSMDNVRSELELTKGKLKKGEKKLFKQAKEIENLNYQLIDMRRKEVQKLFLSMGNHKFNYKTIEERNDIDADVKKVVLGLLKRSMTFPQYRFSQLVYRYAQKKEIQSCMTNIHYQISDATHLPPVNMSVTKFSKKFNEREKEKLRRILSKLKSRYEVADLRWKSRMKEMTGKRQKILKNLLLLFHKLSTDHADMSLIKPVIISRTAFNRPSNRGRRTGGVSLKSFPLFPSPANPRLTASSTEQLIFPQWQPPFENQQVTSAPGLRSLGSSVDRFAPKFGGRFQYFNCPFGNESCRVNRLRKVSHSVTTKKKCFVNSPNLKWPLSDRSVTDVKAVSAPKLLEMDVQSGLRHAKRSILPGLTSGGVGNRSLSLQSTNQNRPEVQLPILSSNWRKSSLDDLTQKDSLASPSKVDKKTSRHSLPKQFPSNL